MQNLAQQKNNQASHFGGIFAPLAQYPGASYAKILSDKIEKHSYTPRNTKREKTYVRSQGHYLRNMPNNTLPFKSALLLVDMESNASLDRTALRDAGIKHVRVLTSGLEAAKILSVKNNETLDEDASVDIVFCHSRFEDMSAVQWIELIRTHPALKELPIVALVGSVVEEEFFQNLDFTALMSRPYSPKILHDKLAHIELAENVSHDETSSAFDAALHRYECCKTEEGRASFYIEEGLRFVQQKQWDNAIQSFNRAIAYPSQQGDAELGLAAAWRGKQNLEKFRYYVYEAGLTFTRTAQWTKARSAYIYMLKVLPKAPSPFVRTAQSYVRAGAFAKAAMVLVKGIDLSPHENVAKHIANACLYTEDPPHTLKKIKQTFVDKSLEDVVKALDKNLHEAFVSRQNTVSKGREERAKLEQKVMAHRASQEQANIQTVISLESELEYDDGLANLNYDDEEISILETIPGNPSLMQDDYVRKNAQGAAIDLLQESDVESQMFTSFPKLNEAATVIKTTFKLLKK